MPEGPDYFMRPAAAFVRGSLHDARAVAASHALLTTPLDMLSDEEQAALVELGVERGLRVHRFKHTMGLQRVQRVLGVLRGVQPTSLLDIGSGRGAFLWPLLDAFPTLPITALDRLEHRVRDLRAVHAGGVVNLLAVQGDTTALTFADGAFDVVTMLETLEHIPEWEQALAEVCRVARRFLLLSVPSKPDTNPEHIHLFDAQALTARLRRLGVARVSVDYVLNHLIVVARIAGSP